MERYLFIINPKSGTRDKKNLIDDINALFDPNYTTIQITEYASHASIIAQNGIKEGYTTIIAIGGDGTINEVASQLINSKVKFGIVPLGSGNGFARHLRIPLNQKKALGIIKAGNADYVDVIQANDRISCNTLGIGFDAYVTKHFGVNGSRGLRNYLRLGLGGYANYKPFDVTIEGVTYRNLLALEIANSSQLGYNAYISPRSSITDGVAEIVMLKKPKWYHVPLILYYVFIGDFHKYPHGEIYSYAQAHLKVSRIVEQHIDGDFYRESDTLQFAILPKSLCVIS